MRTAVHEGVKHTLTLRDKLKENGIVIKRSITVHTASQHHILLHDVSQKDKALQIAHNNGYPTAAITTGDRITVPNTHVVKKVVQPASQATAIERLRDILKKAGFAISRIFKGNQELTFNLSENPEDMKRASELAEKEGFKVHLYGKRGMRIISGSDTAETMSENGQAILSGVVTVPMEGFIGLLTSVSPKRLEEAVIAVIQRNMKDSRKTGFVRAIAGSVGLRLAKEMKASERLTAEEKRKIALAEKMESLVNDKN